MTVPILTSSGEREVVVEGLSFFETANLLLGATIEREIEGTPEEEEPEFEFDHIREYTTTDIAGVEGGLDFDLDETLAEFELEDVTFNPARDSVFVTGEVVTGPVNDGVLRSGKSLESSEQGPARVARQSI